jgi:hypothetical protein
MGRWNLTAKQVQEFKETEIGKIPVDWEVKEVKEISKVIDSLHKTPKYANDGYSMVRVTDIEYPSLAYFGVLCNESITFEISLTSFTSQSTGIFPISVSLNS